MDPTVTVNKMRELVRVIQTKEKSLNIVDSGCTIEAFEFAECFSALDSWLSKNGALPEQWKYKDK